MKLLKKSNMKISEAYAQISRRAGRMSSNDYIYYINNVVIPDILPLVQAKWPGALEKITQIYPVIPEFSITATALDARGTALSVVGHTAKVGDIVNVLGTSSYDGYCVVIESITDQIVIGKPFVANETGTLKVPKRVRMPSDFYSIRSVADISYGNLEQKETSIFDRNSYKFMMRGNEIELPVVTLATNLQINYMAKPDLITAVGDDLPFDSSHHQELLPIINYGACLSYFRDRKKADDMKIFFDLYEQSKMNIAILSAKTL